VGAAVPLLWGVSMLKPFFSYYGGKWRAAPHYPAPRHAKICEPFAGSAGYSLRYPDRQVVLCDLDSVIHGVWSFLIRSSPADILALPDLEIGQSTDSLDVCQEARWLIGFWLQGGTARPAKLHSKWATGWAARGWISGWNKKTRERIAAQVDLIKHWRVLNCRYDQLRPTSEMTWFVDPPYNNRAGQKYSRPASAIDFEALGAWCRNLPGQVIVCENDGASWLPFRHFRDIQAGRGAGRSGAKSAEAIWTND
jgi:hypothetical protein